MNIKKLPNGLEINVDSSEMINYFLSLALKQVKNKKPYKYSTAYATGFRIDIRFIETPSKRNLNKRKIMLEKAKKIKLTEFIEEFRSTSTKENQRLISQFCNVFNYWNEESVGFFVSRGKEEVLKFRRIGSKALDLFEQFFKSKGFAFATWTGKEWV
jgi:hypothetical protein